MLMDELDKFNMLILMDELGKSAMLIDELDKLTVDELDKFS